VLAGFWLEHQVVATALHALADSYDVYFVLDASPAKMQATVRLSQDRLIQAGATPVVVSQVIHEWSFEAADAAKAAALNQLLLSRSTSEED
jgi:nicotinamidase-related amidase